jgi:hypothetical protein
MKKMTNIKSRRARRFPAFRDGFAADSVLELLRQQPIVPRRNLGQPVVGDHKGAGLRGGQVIETQCRHPAPAELTTGLEAAVPGDYVVVAIDQDRDIL